MSISSFSKSESGHFPKVVFIHGQPGTAADFGGVMRRLPDSLEAVAYDRPGWGDNRLEVTDIKGNVTYLVDEVLGSSDAGKVILVGYSYGSAVALRTAVYKPELIAGLVLVAPVGAPSSISRLDGFLCAIVTAVRLMIPAAEVAFGRKVKLRALESFSFEQSRLNSDLSGLVLTSISRDLPIELVVGADDLFNPIRGTVELLDRLPGADLVLLKGVGHMVLNQAPEIVAQRVFDLWSGHAEH